jgi:thioesterase domain-containing protein
VAGDDRRGEKRLVAYVVPVGGRTPTVSALRAHLSERLPDYATPAVFQLLDALPVNPNGKVDRLNLPTPDGGRPRLGSEYVAPRTEDERRLVAIWEDVLGVRPVGVRDDFVELGGDSLGAEAVFAAMEPAFGRSLPTSVMGECPTIERLAHAAARASSAAVSVIVPLQPAGVKPPLFCVHGLDGDVVIFDQLARHLAPDRPVIGVRAPDPAAEPEAFESCEALAARYVAAVRARRPAGPYHLAGYSLGATLALEMAQQLRRDGDAVGLLVSIDNPAPGSRYGKLRWTPGYFARAASRLPRLGRGLLALTREQRAAHLRSERRILATKFVHRFRSILRPLLEAPSAADWAARIIGPQVMSARVLRVAEHLQRILRSYEPRPYAGALAVLRARVQPLFTSGSANLEWDRLARGPLSADTVPGSHGSLLLEPHVRELARHLQQRLDEADPIP